ncbi:MAG: hypothetical protein FJ399_04895 [Verrucomicrobia bacterium]|nr:hypothetical protein [Verrucomicrobiota bacterium]
MSDTARCTCTFIGSAAFCTRSLPRGGITAALLRTLASWQLCWGQAAAYVSLSQGWALGTAGFKAALVKDYGMAAEARAWESQGAREIREMRWAATLERCLRALGRTEKAAQTDRKGAPWKAAVALRMKEISQANNRWLSARLHLGRPEAVSVHVGRLRRGQPQKNPDYRKLITVV